MKVKFIYLLFVLTSVVSCTPTSVEKTYSQEDLDYLGIKDPNKMSLASKRALQRNYHKYDEWFGIFRGRPLTGDFVFDEAVVRRDPSKVLLIDDLYFTWYTRTTGQAVGFGTGDPEAKVFPWDKSEIWYATSKDGWDWQEQGPAVQVGETGEYDDRSVFTPEVMRYKDKYYLVYQAVKAPYLNRSKNTVGMAVSDSPHGPWSKTDKPILSPADNGEWLGQKDSRFEVKVQGDFDSQKVHDPTLLFYRNQFYLYYKGERMGERNTAGGREIRWGVAIADNPLGPYKKSEFNPITQSGHEICVWPYQGGIAMISSHDGPEKQTMQFAKDGINFEIRSYIANIPSAMGLVDSLDNERHPTAALEWGLYHEYVIPPGKSWLEGGNYIKRFEFGPRNISQEFVNKK